MQRQFKKMRRQPSRGELETIAQTWSEHCKHKTFSGPVSFKPGGKVKKYKNLFKETIVKATRTLNRKWCLSVFTDNAGIVEFGKGGKWGLAFKAETHNHPCAVEPYGGPRPGWAGSYGRSWRGPRREAGAEHHNFCFGYLDLKKPFKNSFPEFIMRGVVEGVRYGTDRSPLPPAALFRRRLPAQPAGLRAARAYPRGQN